MPEPFCHSCGAVLPESAERCPSCGAPQHAGTPKRKSNRTTIAAFLMISLFVLTLAQGILFVRDPGASFNVPIELSGQRLEITGTVLDPSGNPLLNASVIWQGAERNQSTTTGGDGRFQISELPAGLVTLSVAAEGFGPADVRFFLTQNREARITLLPGTEPQVVHDGSYTNLIRIATFCGFSVIGIGLLLLAGTIAIHRRRNYRLALGAAIAGLFGSLPISLILGTLIIILVVRSRTDFR